MTNNDGPTHAEIDARLDTLMGQLRAEIRTSYSDFGAEVNKGFFEVKREMRDGFTRVDTILSDRFVTKELFWARFGPVQLIVYGFVSMLLAFLVYDVILKRGAL